MVTSLTVPEDDRGFNLDGNPDNPTGHAAGTSESEAGEGAEEILRVMGITNGTEKGSYVFDSSAIERLHKMLTEPAK